MTCTVRNYCAVPSTTQRFYDWCHLFLCMFVQSQKKKKKKTALPAQGSEYLCKLCLDPLKKKTPTISLHPMPLSSLSQETEGNWCGNIPQFSPYSVWIYKSDLVVQTLLPWPRNYSHVAGTWAPYTSLPQELCRYWSFPKKKVKTINTTKRN